MYRIIGSALIVGLCLIAGRGQAQPVLVQDGQAQAAIVVRENPPRLLGLAALELQYYIEQMSGARLPVVHEPQPGGVNLFVGRSRHTDALGISDENLPYGAFRMAGGPNWLALVGYDHDFLPQESFRGDLSREETREIWDAMMAEVADSKWAGPPLTAALWSAPGGFRRTMAARFGEEQVDLLMTARTPDWEGEGISRWDRGGSLNAVYRFLMDLGVRWYMPGEIGEVVPERRTIAVPAVNATVRPDYGLRTFNWSHYPRQPVENIFWALRIGMFSAIEIWPYGWSHNHPRVFSRPEMRERHPEFFALRGGVRQTERSDVCFASEGLLRETVEYGRFIFDRFDMPTLDLWPEDGLRHCGCDECQELTPSDAVFGFVDRVARELYKTHPDRLVTCGAYTPFKDPPATIERFSPNVAVMISNVWRVRLDRPEYWQEFEEFLAEWKAKVSPGHILRWENNFHNSREGLEFPVIQTRAMATELKALRGISMGEFHNWQMRPRIFHNPGNSHLTLYSMAQFLWDGGQDVDAFLDEYYRLFYGPAYAEMKEALEFAQDNYVRGRTGPSLVSAEVKVQFMERLHAARARAGETVYGERIQLMMDELPDLDALRRLAYEEAHAPDPRADAPLLVGLDGQGPEGAAVHRMRVLRTGEEPEIETTFQVWWHDNALWFDVRCEEPDMENLFATTLVYDGDAVVFVIETPVHSFYHIEISPEGRVFDRVPRPPAGMGAWDSQAEVVETEQGDDFWRVRVRLPVSGEDGLEMDPNHLVAGGKPTEDAPWFLNVGRSRVRERETHFAFNPTERGSYHVPDAFARFMVR